MKKKRKQGACESLRQAQLALEGEQCSLLAAKAPFDSKESTGPRRSLLFLKYMYTYIWKKIERGGRREAEKDEES